MPGESYYLTSEKRSRNVKLNSKMHLVLRTNLNDLPDSGTFYCSDLYMMTLVARTGNSNKHKFHWGIVVESIPIIEKITIRVLCVCIAFYSRVFQ